MPGRIRRKRQSGYTLTEMMIMLAVIGILAAIVIPNLNGYLRRTRQAGAENRLMSDVYYARSMAIAKRRTFQLQFNETGYQVIDTADSSVVRATATPQGVTFTASGNPNFYAWGLADAANITVSGSAGDNVISVLPTGTVECGY